MSFQINKFRTGLKGGIARPNLFEVNISVPTTVPLDTTIFPFQCKLATIPPSTMGVIEVPYFGRMIKIPGNRTFDNLSLTVINDEGFLIRDAVENWMELMNHHRDNKSSATMVDIQADISVKHFKVDGTASGDPWTFVDAFPVSLGEISLDWGSNDTAEEFSIDFAYDYWKRGAGTSAAPRRTRFSDYRLKDNISLVQKATSEIPNLYFFTYKWDADTAYIGVMAQELLDTGYSSAVHKSSDGYYSVDYTKLGVPLVKISKPAMSAIL